MKEILLYSAIYGWTAEDFINRLEANSGNAITVRMNCPGGDVLAGYGMFAKFNEHKQEKKVKVDGAAKSMGAYFCAAASEVECLTVTEFLLHRAAYPSWLENDKAMFTDAMKASLATTNNHLRTVLEAKVNADLFKKVTGVSMDDMFSLDSRIDVVFNAEKALKMGLVSKVVPLTTAKKKEVQALAAEYGVAAFASEVTTEDEAPEANDNDNHKKPNKMTLAEIREKYPQAYADIVAEGVKAERIRVNSILAWHKVDPQGVLAMIKEGKEMTADVTQEMTVKAIGMTNLAAAQADGAPEVVPGEKPKEGAKTAQQIEDEKGFDAVNKMLGITAQA